jgi:hypothetical protein
MENNTNTTNSAEKTGLFSLLYRTRIVITKGETTIVNLSILYCIIALLCAPWVIIIGGIVALVLGYHFAINRNAAGFAKDVEHAFKDAADNVRKAVDNVKSEHCCDHDHKDDNTNGGSQE